MSSSCLFEVDPNIMTKILTLYEQTEESLNQSVITLREWIKTQPHLPEIMRDKSIQNILILCKCSIEKAKQRIDMYYTVRDKIPDLYEDINPKFSKVKEAMNIAYYLSLPKMTKDMYRVTIFKLRIANMIDNLEPRHVHKVLINTFEIRLNEDTMLGDIYIFDMSGVTFSYMTKINPSLISKLLTIYEKVFSLPLKGMYFINSPSYIDALMKVIKQLLSSKLFDRVHVCQDDSILKERFPKEILPKDYGGEEKSMEQLKELQKEHFVQYQERFDRLDTLKVDERLRPEKLKNDEVLGFYGNFKQLNVD